MLDSSKSVIIFSHPRSGSTWFQGGFPQYNLSELFDIYLKYNVTNGIHCSYSPAYCGNPDKSIELHNRFEIYNQFVEQYGAVSVKLHCNHYNDTIGSFLETLDIQYVLLERWDKIKTLWSLLIALSTFKFHITTVTSKKQQSVTISKEVFDDCVNVLKQSDDNSRMIISKYNPTIIYYEDLLNGQYPNGWVPNNGYLIQNAKEYTDIINLDEVNDWMNEINYWISNFTELH